MRKPPCNHTRHASLLPLLLVLVACVPTQPVLPEPPAAAADVEGEAGELARDFALLAFRQANDGLRATPAMAVPLTRAALPMRIMVTTEDFMSPAAQRSARSLAATAVATIRGGSGVDVTITDRDAPVVIVYTDQRYFPELRAFLAANYGELVGRTFDSAMANGGCFMAAVDETPHLHAGGYIAVDVAASAAMQSRCVYRSLPALLGLAGTFQGDTAVFNVTRPATGYTRRDLDLIQMAYSPILRPGMTETQANPLLPAVAASVLADN